MEFFDQMEPLLKIFWYVALPSSLIFLIQTVMTFMGMDSSDALDDGAGLTLFGAETPSELFSLRNLINFLLGFSWTGISFYTTISNKFTLILVALQVGILFVFLFLFIIRQLQKLSEDNTFQIESTLHKRAEVYLSIPGHMQGVGKITISINGSFRELEAMTEHERIETGALVEIQTIESNNVLIVKPIQPE